MRRRDFLGAIAAIGTAGLPGISRADFKLHEPGKRLQPPTTREESKTKVGIVAIGGAACCMLPALAGKLPGVTRSIAIDTSSRVLTPRADGSRSIRLGNGYNKPVNPSVAANLAYSAADIISDAMSGLHMIFVLAGLGGAAGSGIAPVVANLAKQQNSLAVGAAILPFEFEGERRNTYARKAKQYFSDEANTLFLLENDRYANSRDSDISMRAALEMANAHFIDIYKGITLPFQPSGLLGYDYEDMREVLCRPGYSACGSASCLATEGPRKAFRAALRQPGICEGQFTSAKAVHIGIEDSSTDSLNRYRDLARMLRESYPEKSIVMSLHEFNHEQRADLCRVTILASGIEPLDDQKLWA